MKIWYYLGMSAFLITLFLTAGVCAWLYNYLQRRSGNNTEQSIIATGVAGAILFLIVYTVLGLVL